MISPYNKLRAYFSNYLYDYIANKLGSEELTVFNFGVKYPNIIAPRGYGTETLRLNMYQLVAKKIILQNGKLKDKKVLEAGSGRGLGAKYLVSTYKPFSYVGIDISSKSIQVAKTINNGNPKLKFLVGDVHKMPFQNDTFDVVLNIESSHWYENFNLFLSEVSRVLKSGGYFGFADFRDKTQVEELKNDFRKSNLKIVYKENITKYVVQALPIEEKYKIKAIENKASSFLKPFFKQFAGLSGTGMYKKFSTGEEQYWIYVLMNSSKSK